MYCKNCGNEISEGSRFCNHCGTPVETQLQPEPRKPDLHSAPAPVMGMEEAPRRQIIEDINWDTGDYPDRNVVEKTEDIDFNWNARPEDIPDTPRRDAASAFGTDFISNAASHAPTHADVETLRGEDFDRAVFGQAQPKQPERRPADMSAAERIDKFYTFNSKNEEFQRLINNEFERVKSGNAIEHELFEADRNADQRFQSRPVDSSMEAFLEREGVVKSYQPKAFQSDVLQRIEAQEAEREAKRLEEEARLAAIEEARLEAEARMRAEEEAKRKAEEEVARLAEAARRKAEEEAKAAEEARIRAIEEAKRKAEEEAKRRVEEEARRRAEAEARVKAAEEARLRAEADLRAAQEAAKIRAQQEARLAAQAEAQFKAEQERKKLVAEEAQRQLEARRMKISLEANQVVAQEEVRKVLEQTARMQAEEQAKIRAAVAGLRGGAQEPEINKEVQEAHQATRNQINEMAKARDAYFADFEPQEETYEPEIPEEPKQEDLVTGRNTMLSASDEIAKTRVIDKRAIAAGLNEATRVASVKAQPAPVDDDEFFNSLDAAAQLNDELADLTPVTEQPMAQEPQPMDFREDSADDIDDLLSQFEAVNDLSELPQEKPGLENTALMPQDDTLDSYPVNDFDSYGNEEAERFMNQQLAQEQAQAQMQQQQPEPAQYSGGFEQNAADDFYGGDFYEDETNLSKKERKQKEKEQKRLEKEKAKEEKASKKKAKHDRAEEGADGEEEKGGAGRVVLKIVLVLLIIILAVEIVGMGIRFLAPQSPAAEFIDQQLNKVIQLITGEEDTEYTLMATDN